ncbi:hypothetical protein CLOSYM_01379 [[Clostridium] symbiosum ATCC 14940]|uniref:Uncharacterized protein n=1 Tax=[Clostridium] symbiosum ATCC 14940 TaxID=411472 RepID=A0ABC9U0K0_CLOSY|nr:hypothetical protein CLOSYM_01379 [[Clostridium] symbiosum ATCC 14940]
MIYGSFWQSFLFRIQYSYNPVCRSILELYQVHHDISTEKYRDLLIAASELFRLA